MNPSDTLRMATHLFAEQAIRHDAYERTIKEQAEELAQPKVIIASLIAKVEFFATLTAPAVQVHGTHDITQTT